MAAPMAAPMAAAATAASVSDPAGASVAFLAQQHGRLAVPTSKALKITARFRELRAATFACPWSG